MGSQRYFNPQHKSPSYADMGQTKPRSKWDSKPLPIRYITCFKCHRNGGTLIKTFNPKTKKEDYAHSDCIKQEEAKHDQPTKDSE